MTNGAPQYRFRGNVAPCAEVSRPAAAYRNATAAASTGGNGSMSGPTTATLDIFDVIDSLGGWWGISALDVDAALQQVGAVDTLYVRVNSPGGDASEGVAIANLLRAHPADVRVTVYGIAASAASVIAMGGDMLSMAPGSTLMVHEAVAFAYGTADDMVTGRNYLDAISDGYASLYALKAGGTSAEWRARMKQTTWYTPDAAVTAKLADRVGIDPLLPSDLPPVEDDAEADLVIELDIELNAAARAAAKRFDLSMLPGAAAAFASKHPKTPAEPPVIPPHNPEEADAMSETLSKGLRERLGVTDESIGEDGLLAALDEALTEAADSANAQANAGAASPELSVLRRELESTQTQLRSLADARQRDEADAKAAAKQRVFDEAFARGAVHPVDHPERIQDEADYDAAPEVMTRVLAGRADSSRFPAKASGYTPSTDDKPANDDGWFPQFSRSAAKVEA